MKRVGIYKIVNLMDNKVYVGSSSRLRQRKHEHFKQLENNKHRNTYLQNSYNKHGKSNFEWEVIEYLEFNENKTILKNNLLEREQYWIDELRKINELYNLCPIAGSKLGARESKEAIRKRSIANTGKKRTKAFRDRMSRLRKGRCIGCYPKKVFSEEHIKNLSESHKGYKLSDEHKRKIGEYHENRPKEIQDRMSRNHMKSVVNMSTGIVFNSIKEAGEFYNINRGHISSVCKGERKTAGGYQWSYFKNKKQLDKISFNNKVVKNIDTGLIFSSVMEASKYYNIGFSHIARVCRGERKTAGGYRWYYL